MKSKSCYILCSVFMMLVFHGCKSNSIESSTSQPAENNEINPELQKDKEKLLDMALQMSGETLEPDQRALAVRMLSLNEKDLIRGLAQWLLLLDGKYPDTLEPKAAIRRAEKLYSEKYSSSEQAKEQTYDVFFASTFYDKLIREKKDVVYYGDKITTEDKERILIRWKIEKNKYRVVFGDLRLENVSAERLNELET